MLFNSAQHLPMDWSVLESLKKLPPAGVIALAVKTGVKDTYTKEEYNALNQNKIINRVTKGDIRKFIFLCLELNDRNLITKNI